MIQHQLSEIKTRNEKLAARHLRQLNHALDDALNADDPLWRACQARLYNKLLAIGHKDGVAGSLLEQEDREGAEILVDARAKARRASLNAMMRNHELAYERRKAAGTLTEPDPEGIRW